MGEARNSRRVVFMRAIIVDGWTARSATLSESTREGTMNRRQLFATPMLGMAALQAATVKATLPDAALRISDPEKYWLRVRKEQFFLPDWRAFLNNGSLGVIPRPVYAAVTEYMERAAGLMMDEYPRWGYETLDAERTEMAEF